MYACVHVCARMPATVHNRSMIGYSFVHNCLFLYTLMFSPPCRPDGKPPGLLKKIGMGK